MTTHGGNGMSKSTVQRIHRIYGILLAIVTVVAGVCLMVACVNIYQSGDKPYSREAVAAAFAPISVPVYICLGLITGGCLLQLFLPVERERLKALPAVSRTLERLYARTDVTRWEEEPRRKVLREQKARWLHRQIAWGLAVAGATVFLAYALNSGHYSTDVNGTVIRAMCWLVPCVAVPGGYGLFACFHAAASLRRELAVLSMQIVAHVVDEEKHDASPDRSVEAVKSVALQMPTSRKKGWMTPRAEVVVRYSVLAVGLALLVYGFATGGITDVLTKAVNICTECIGLG